MTATKVPDVFATQLCDSGGMLWLGGYDSTFTTAAPQYTPMLTTPQEYYAVNLKSITVEGKTAAVGTSQYPATVIDTGTQFFTMPSVAYTVVVPAIVSSPQFQTIFGQGVEWFLGVNNPNLGCTAIHRTKAELDVALPPLTMTFGSNPEVSIQVLPTESYLVPAQDMWCPGLVAFDPSPSLPVSILGAPVMRGSVIIFDRAKRRVGFAPHTPCK
jgi:hypothetical protein